MVEGEGWKVKNILIMVLAVGLLAALTGEAKAFVWTEIGDAGQLLGTAQVVNGTGSLTSIAGNLGSNEVDMYSLYIATGSAFSATTAGTTWDTQLFLFNASGYGVCSNDDMSGANLQSTLPAGHAYSPSVAGVYYLAIARYDYDPTSAGGQIFLDSPFNAVHNADGPGGSQTFNGWTGSNNAAGSYTIYLTGASANTLVPEPATMVLFSFGGLAMAARKLRRGKKAQINLK